MSFILRLLRNGEQKRFFLLPRWLLWINDKKKTSKIMWTWTRSSSFKSFFCFRNWLKNISNFIFLADRLSGRTWYGLLDVWYHTFLARATLSPSPLPYFSWLFLWPITFSRASTFSTAQQNNGPYFLFFIFLHSYLLYFYCVKRYYTSSLTCLSHKFLFRSLNLSCVPTGCVVDLFII